MNLIEKYISPIAFENINLSDKLIVSEIIEDDGTSKSIQIKVGDIVSVDNMYQCEPEDLLEECKDCPCRHMIIETSSDTGIGTSCFYRYTTLDGRVVR